MGYPFPFEAFYKKYSDVIEFILVHANNPLVDLSNKTRIRKDWKAISFILWYELFINENVQLFKKIEDMVSDRATAIDLKYVPQFLKCWASAI